MRRRRRETWNKRACTGEGSPPSRLGLEDISNSCHHDLRQADLEILSQETALHSAAAGQQRARPQTVRRRAESTGSTQQA